MLRVLLLTGVLTTLALATDDACLLPKKIGGCFGSFERWYYNGNSSTCEKFIFGGCDGNDNNFDSEKDCRETCIAKDDMCKLPKEPGPCKALMERWYFSAQGRCERFAYGGCHGNANNFVTEMDCVESCGGYICPAVLCRSNCPSGFETDRYGCQMCVCKENDQCPQLECDAVFCEHGFERDDEDCPTCKCKEVVCSPVRCFVACEHGFDADENGCETCKCKPAPTPVECPEAMCMMYCENGFQVVNGCPICKCKEQPPCPAVACDMFCERGFDSDTNGCHVCQCKPEPTPRVCSDVMCAMYCEHGFQVDEDGCSICRCRQPCPAVACRMFCENGFETDKDGCSMCKCRNPTTTRPSTTPVVCQGVVCQMFCDTGFQRDDRGCEVCRCNPPVPTPLPSRCPAVMCAVRCQYGVEKNANGCVTCKCRTQPLCPEMHCSRCSQGYTTDERGCETCQCKDHGCETILCSSRQICRMQTVQCFAAPCPLSPTCVDVKDDEICQLPKETGRCRAYFRHWYFNGKSARCERFVYGGCGGNANNFKTEAACKAKCEAPVLCGLFCEFGYADDTGCTCLDSPCKGTACAIGKVCAVKKKMSGKHEALCVYDQDASVEHTFVIEHALPAEDRHLFKKELHYHMRQWLQVDGDRLLTLEVTEPTDSQPVLRVTFRLANDQVDSSSQVLARFSKKILKGACVLHFGTEAYPVRSGSQSWPEGQEQTDSGFSRNDAIITASMVALVCVLSIVAIVVICAYTRTKRNRHNISPLTNQELAFNNEVYGGAPVITAPSAQEQPEKVVPGMPSLLETKSPA